MFNCTLIAPLTHRSLLSHICVSYLAHYLLYMVSSCSANSWIITIALSTWALGMICSKIWTGIQTLIIMFHDKCQPFRAKIYPFPKCICVSAMLPSMHQGHLTDILPQPIQGASVLVYNLQQILFQVQYVPLHIRKMIELHTPEIKHCNL